MINFREALRKVSTKQYKLAVEKIPVSLCVGSVLAETIIAPIGLPIFNNSAVDGFAVDYRLLYKASLTSPKKLVIGGIIKAGSKPPLFINKQHCWRIMTGALVPKYFNAIIMQENVKCYENIAQFFHPAYKNQNIRFNSEDISIGKKILDKGSKLTLKDLGIILALGIAKILVYKRPSASIIATGSELVLPGKKLKDGKVYYCNGKMVAELVKSFGVKVISEQIVIDDFNKIKKCIENSLCNDLVIVIGGISVGKYDFVKNIFEDLCINNIFYKGNWRPGKPLFFGDFKGKPIWGLPGNPIAAFTMTNIFLQECIYKMQGMIKGLPWKLCKLKHNFYKKSKITYFVQSYIDDSNMVSILPNQESHRLGNLIKSNSICYLDDNYSEIKKNSFINVMLLKE